MSAQTETITDDKEVQTVIRVSPHILGETLKAYIKADRKCQTIISVKPDQENKKFYSMLEYTPYQDIQEQSIRTIDLPRKQRLKFDSYAKTKLNLMRNCLYVDDDALSELYIDLKKRIEEQNAIKTMWQDRETQTELIVRPHLLEEDKVASISVDCATETEECCCQI